MRDQFDDIVLGGDVQTGGRFIKQKHLRLLLPAGLFAFQEVSEEFLLKRNTVIGIEVRPMFEAVGLEHALPQGHFLLGVALAAFLFLVGLSYATVDGNQIRSLVESLPPALQAFVRGSDLGSASGYVGATFLHPITLAIMAATAIAHGGMFGRGLFKGAATNLAYVPEQQTDFIYSVAGEELGFLGSGLIVVLLGLIVWRALRISGRAPDTFGRLAAATEFHERANYAMGKLPKFMWLDADQVVATAWADMERGRALSVPGAVYKLARTALRFGR